MKQTNAMLAGQVQLSWPQVQSSEPGHHHNRAPRLDRPPCRRLPRADQVDVHDRAGGQEFHQLGANGAALLWPPTLLPTAATQDRVTSGALALVLGG